MPLGATRFGQPAPAAAPTYPWTERDIARAAQRFALPVAEVRGLIARHAGTVGLAASAVAGAVPAAPDEVAAAWARLWPTTIDAGALAADRTLDLGVDHRRRALAVLALIAALCTRW
jgi:hypothetical protein